MPQSMGVSVHWYLWGRKGGVLWHELGDGDSQAVPSGLRALPA